MKQIFIMTILTFSILLFSCGQNTVIIQVIDKKKNQPIDSAKVVLQKMDINYIDLEFETQYTDLNGKCKFFHDIQKQYFYSVHAEKNNYYPYYNKEDNFKYESSIKFDPKKDKQIKLFLTSDSSNVIEYYNHITPDLSIDELINLLKSNSYNQMIKSHCIPDLNWIDIPKLLKIGDSEIIINQFPRSGLSSSPQKECYLGIVALWLIEIIRKDENKIRHPIEKYVSQNPYLYNNQHKQLTRQRKNTRDELITAFTAYKDWWKTVQKIKKEKARKINPLKNTGLSWENN